MVNKVGGSPKAREFYNSLPKDSRLKKEIDLANELLKGKADIGDKIENRKEKDSQGVRKRLLH